MTRASKPTADTIIELFERRGPAEYGGESVSQLEHALQCAALAQAAGSSDELVAAALLHDVGHLLHDLGEDAAERGVDDVHERLGAEWLAAHTPPAVVEPVRLHVAAKRYLCAVNSAYYDRLSEGSRVSLQLQGGPMSPPEVEAFRRLPYWKEAAQLRQWDDGAKTPGAPTPTLENLRGVLEKALAKP